MYRQILVDKADTDLQRIVWRASPNEPIRCFRLVTVTYGTAAAPYLACRTLRQLADDYEAECPIAANLLRQHFYIDDALFGAFDKTSAVQARKELCYLLRQGCFKLRKWLSNSPDLLDDVPEEEKELPTKTKIVNDPEFKALGVGWDPVTDKFTCRIALPKLSLITKRSVLTDISRIYDPLGWFSPTTITSKMFLQKLWLAKFNWDDPLPPNLCNTWTSYRNDLEALNHIQIDRWVGITKAPLGVELHGFCDASLSAYSAAVYLRVIHEFDNIQVSLVTAKTRVTPLRAISLPRLELCGAALLAELLHYIQHNLHFEHIPSHVWTDSTVVLDWLREHPAKWKVFVANRVSLINEKLPGAKWHHVCSEDNPADCATRGITAKQLQNHSLWWSGPSWLYQNSALWPHTKTSSLQAQVNNEKELRSLSAFMSTRDESELELLFRYSNLNTLLRVTAYCKRFLYNSKSKDTDRKRDHLTPLEVNAALETWIKLVQQYAFSNELHCLANKKPLPQSSKLLLLNPFLDPSSVLRLGGRLTHSELNYDEKFPIILPKNSQLTYLIIANAHYATLHGGVQTTLHHIRTKYWILGGRSKVRQYIHHCVKCYRFNATPMNQLMGELPAERVRPSKPFLTSGVDFAGPLYVQPVKGRRQKTIKSYAAIFVCFVTRATHLELVMDLSSDAFLAAFRRFVSRRGRCSILYSDNATNFVGADKQLTQHVNSLARDSHITKSLLNDSTEWRFIPPASPHFGGLWEAGVKLVKHHLRRVVGDHHLTIEEMTTLLTQIEACLNSRPLYALTDDPTDVSALTPGHFLVGENLLTIPAPSLLDSSVHRLSRWEMVQHMVEHIWSRWYKEYIHHLQVRNKWSQGQKSVGINDLVLIKEDRLPPSKWSLGRITETHPGSDGRVRVVTLRHKDGYCKRPITKLCALPIHT